jgi:hypothetical protein
MTHSAVKVQIAEAFVPSTPSWLGEVAAFAQVLEHEGILTAITERMRFARVRFGRYDLIDFVAVLLGYILSGEPTLLAFYERLDPWAEPFMALFGRDRLPHRSALSRFLAAFDQTPVEALRTRCARGSAGSQTVSFSWWLIRPDRSAVDRGRCGRDPTSCPKAGHFHRRSCYPLPIVVRDQVCADIGIRGASGEKWCAPAQSCSRHIPTSCLRTFGGPGNGDYRGELLRAIAVITEYARHLGAFSCFRAASSRWALWRCCSAPRCSCRRSRRDCPQP